ncbi:MAG TPA: four helix bundle protein [Chitinophagales bacterium]|nr:four helix bundle protein [Chitinophagales bacterium]
MPTYKSFTELECWKIARDIRNAIGKIIKMLPKEEQFDLMHNMRRASRSCTRNIAEGFGRFHYQENIQFCRISRGSMNELIDDLITCYDDKYISKKMLLENKMLIDNGIKSLNGYIRYLGTAKKTG